MGWNYTDKVKEHFFTPKNVGRIDNPDGLGEVGSIACGDALSLTLRIDRERDTIVDARFQTFGCGSAIASSSMLTEMIKGMRIDDALKISNKDIAEALGGLPAEKMHCSVMGREALEAAVANYRGEQVKKEEDEGEGRIVCYCFGVTEGKIRRVVEENDLRTVEDVTNYTKAGGGCGSCLDAIQAVIDDVRGHQPAPDAKKAEPRKKLTNLERIALIQEVIDQEVRPLLQKDDGDLQLLDVDGTRVTIRMTGHCAGCRAAGLTTRWIEDKLREIVDPTIVLDVSEEV